MATSLVSTGVQFPDSTIQTTAALASQYQAVASGTLANGSLVVVNADGTVSAVNSNSQSAGTAATYVAGTSVSDVCATYDVTNNKVVVAYIAGNAPAAVYAVVGTVSGTNISFGTPVFIISNGAYLSITYDTAQSKVVIAYANASTNVGAVQVGTVSGTSISFVTAVNFVTGSYPTFISAAYEATQSRVVIAYTDQANSAFGTAVVGSVSGTITFGTPVVIVAATVMTYLTVAPVGSSKAVISYRNLSSSSVGTSIVGTVTSTSISFGTPVVFNNATTLYIRSTYDTTSSKVVVVYADNGNSDYGTAIVGTVSGTSISFGSEVVFESAYTSSMEVVYSVFANRVVISWSKTSNTYATTITGLVSGTGVTFGTASAANAIASVSCTGLVYDSTSQKVVFAYRNNTASSGQSQVLTVGFTNLSATNYIGISGAAYASSATATIQTVGSVDDAQTSLTPGLAYYVQTDGTLASTAGSPSVFAGTAVAATKILVKG